MIQRRLRAQEQCLLAAVCQNMKKMAMLVSGSNTDSEKDSIWPVVQFLKRHIKGFIVTQKLVWA